MQLSFGFHIGLQKTLHETVTSTNQPCCQFFLGSKIKYETRTVSASDRESTIDHCRSCNKRAYVHCPYILNLSKEESEKSKYSLMSLMDNCYGIAPCVLHIGTVGSLENVVANLQQLDTDGYFQPWEGRRPLLLEVSAGQGSSLGKNYDQMRKLFEGLDSRKIGICLDTQHWFAAGQSTFGSHEETVKCWDELTDIGPLGLIHLNDSKVEFDSRVDRHLPLRQGNIWYQDDEGLKTLLQLSRDSGVDLIAETSDPANDYQYLNKFESGK